MKILLTGIAALAICLAPPLLARSDDVSAELAEFNRMAAELGQRIYLHDQAAWHGTDALFASIDAKDHPELRGYVTEERNDGTVDLIFYAEVNGGHYEFARYQVASSQVVAGASTPICATSRSPRCLSAKSLRGMRRSA